MAKKGAKPGKATEPDKTEPEMVKLTGDALPRRTLEDAILIAKTLHDTYAGKSATTEELSQTAVLPKTNATKYLFWAAQAYRIISKEDGKQTYSLAETGRKIVSPNYPEEKLEGIRKAVLTPTLLSKFFSDYDGHPLPAAEFFPNVLKNKFNVPADRVPEAMTIIVKNGRFAGFLEDGPAGAEPIVRLGGAAVPAVKDESEAGALAELPATPSGVEVSQVAWSKTCFYITPIGDEGTEIRKHADMMLKHLIEPVATAKEFGFEVVRADRIERSGLITRQIFEYLVRSRLCIADLSFANPNAFYELGVRHVCRRPAIQIIRKSDRIPFDVSQGRTIKIDTSDVYTVVDRIESAKRELAEHIRHIVNNSQEDSGDENPINVYLPGLKVTLPK
ncbi:MAG TPA: hypothetical protein VH374_02805 [Polyangia bacterium]|jgi:hypothetical protein|nr:hypothetical protein [Polyangia bacterium]